MTTAEHELAELVTTFETFHARALSLIDRTQHDARTCLEIMLNVGSLRLVVQYLRERGESALAEGRLARERVAVRLDHLEQIHPAN